MTAGGGDLAPPRARERAREIGRRALRLTRLGLREPLVHFLAIGAILFAGITVWRAGERPRVVIDAQDVEQLVQYWELQAQRPPSRDELGGIIQDRIDEELLAREAKRLGLDRGDLIVRRRLAQKMAFATEGAVAEPDEAALRAFFAREKTRYAEPARAALRHVLFSADRGRAAAEAAARAALARASASGTDPVGDPSLLPLTYADVSLLDLKRDYGPDFARAAAASPTGLWTGPVSSGLGYHLVRVERRTPDAIPAFDRVRAQVRDDYLAAERKRASDAFLQKLRARYRVEVAGAAR